MVSSATLAFRTEQLDLKTVALADLKSFWSTLDYGDALGTKRELLAVVPDLVQAYGEMGAASAMDYYEEMRAEAAGIRAAHRTVMPDPVPTDATQASTRWAINPLWTKADDLAVAQEAALTNLSGIVGRQILTPARETVRLNTQLDPAAYGWRRIGNGDSCTFCRMLIGRGNVYSKDTADFAAHDRCDCMAETSFQGGGEPATAMQYIGSKRKQKRSPAERAQLRQYLLQFED